MSKRFTDTDIWDKEWFMNLSPKLKCLVKYVRDKSDAAGVWTPNWTLAIAHIKESVTELELMEIDSGNQFKKIGGKIACVGFVNFQYGILTESCPPHRKIIALIDKYNIKNDRVLLGYQYPNERVLEEDKEKEEDKDKEKDKSEKSPFDLIWDKWVKYRSEIKKPIKTASYELAKKELTTLSSGNPELAEKIINQSIKNSWQGLFEIKQPNHKPPGIAEPVKRGQEFGKL